MMKKILFAVPLLAFAFTFTACDPTQDDDGPGASVAAETLSSELNITPQSEGNNNLTFYTVPSRYIKVYDEATGAKVGEGTVVKVQVVPPARTVGFYITTINPDGSITKSGTRQIAVSEFTDLPEIYNYVFGDGKGGYTTTTWTWDTTDNGGVVWGNGGYLENTAPGWWTVRAEEIDGQAAGKDLPSDGLSGWFSLDLSTGVKTSRGETGMVSVSGDMVKPGWDIGKMTFSGTVPLLGIQPNVGNARQYDYHILKADGTHLYLCAPEPGAGDWGTAWFWCFKKK